MVSFVKEPSYVAKTISV